MYAKIDGTKIVKYPYTLKDLQRENPNVSFPRVLGDELKAQYNLVDVNENSKPTFDPLKENIVASFSFCCFSLAIRCHLICCTGVALLTFNLVSFFCYEIIRRFRPRN